MSREESIDYESVMKEAGADVGPEPQTDREMLLYLMDAFDAESWVCSRCAWEESTMATNSAQVLRQYLEDHPPTNPQGEPT